MHGSQTNGWGAKKKHRGSGHRGGFGMAGSGKRADQKKISILKEFGNEYFGKHGFNRPQKQIIKINAVNIGYLDNRLELYLEQNLVEKAGDTFVVDLVKLGFQKVLGKGDLTHKIKIKAPFFSESAIEKIKNAGGEIEGKDVTLE